MLDTSAPSLASLTMIPTRHTAQIVESALHRLNFRAFLGNTRERSQRPSNLSRRGSSVRPPSRGLLRHAGASAAAMYQAVTRSIRVSVTPHFMQDRSDPDDDKYFWAYAIDIVNEGQEAVQLQSRYWHITDEQGRVEEVRGKGVVGETPVIEPGATFSYTSGCPLSTPSGIMVGQFFMISATGEKFAVDVPAFSLDSPGQRRTVN
jgi:ApaG protein